MEKQTQFVHLKKRKITQEIQKPDNKAIPENRSQSSERDSGNLSISDLLYKSHRTLSMEDLPASKQMNNTKSTKDSIVQIKQRTQSHTVAHDENLQIEKNESQNIFKLVNVVMDLKNEVKSIRKNFFQSEYNNNSLKGFIESQKNQIEDMRQSYGGRQGSGSYTMSITQQDQNKELREQNYQLLLKLEEIQNQFKNNKIKDKELIDNQRNQIHQINEQLAIFQKENIMLKKLINASSSNNYSHSQNTKSDAKIINDMHNITQKVPKIKRQSSNVSSKQSPNNKGQKQKLQLAYLNHPEPDDMNKWQYISLENTSSFIQELKEKSTPNHLEIDSINLSSIKNKSIKLDKSTICDKSCLQAMLEDQRGLVYQFPLEHTNNIQINGQNHNIVINTIHESLREEYQSQNSFKSKEKDSKHRDEMVKIGKSINSLGKLNNFQQIKKNKNPLTRNQVPELSIKKGISTTKSKKNVSKEKTQHTLRGSESGRKPSKRESFKKKSQDKLGQSTTSHLKHYNSLYKSQKNENQSNEKKQSPRKQSPNIMLYKQQISGNKSHSKQVSNIPTFFENQKLMKRKRNNTITELKNSKNIEKIFRKSEYNRENIPLSSILQNKNDNENIGKKSSKNMQQMRESFKFYNKKIKGKYDKENIFELEASCKLQIEE